MNRLHLSDISSLSIPLQLAAATVVVGFAGMKIGSQMGGDFGAAMGLMVGLIVGFFGYIAVIIKREQ